MPNVAEVLKSAGLSDEQIAAIDAKAVTAFSTVLSTAEQERQQGELAQRSATQMFDETIAPALASWGNKEATLSAERDYYKTLAEKAKTGGFIAEAPPFKAEAAPGGRDDGGRFVAGANVVPGSPNFQEFENKVGQALGTLSDLQWRYQSLYGKVMPDAPTALAAEAAAQRMPLLEYAAKKYDFTGKETAIKAEEQKKHDDAIRKEATESVEKKYAEAGGGNPNIRQAQTSRYAEIRKGVADGSRPDPLKMSPEQRRAATANAIRQDVAAQAVQ